MEFPRHRNRRAAVYPPPRATGQPKLTGLGLCVLGLAWLGCGPGEPGGEEGPVSEVQSQRALALPPRMQALRDRCEGQPGLAWEDGACVCAPIVSHGVEVHPSLLFEQESPCALPTGVRLSCLEEHGSFQKTLESGGRDALARCVQVLFKLTSNEYPTVSSPIAAKQKKASVLGIQILPDTDDADCERLASWLDERLVARGEDGARIARTLPLRQGFHPTKTFFMDVLFGGTPESRAALFWQNQGFVVADPSDPAISLQRASQIATGPEDLDRIFGLGEGEPAVPFMPADLPVAEPAFAALARAAVDPGAEAARSEWVVFEDCLHLCGFQREFQLDGGVRRVDQWTYLAGVRTAGVSYFYEGQNDFPTGIIWLSPQARPLYLGLLSYHREEAALLQRLVVYDPTWKVVARGERAVEPSFSSLERRVEEAAPLAAGGISVVDCGDAFDFTRDPLRAAFLRGPSTSAGSLLGWVRSAPGALRGYLDGLITLEVGSEDNQAERTHMAAVDEVLIGSRDGLRVIPVSAAKCLHGQERWAGSAHEVGQARVINLSKIFLLDGAFCRESVALDPRFLWVAGAGNAGNLFQPGETLVRCPQALGPLPNLIVAAMGNGQAIDRASDAGRDYADLVCDGGSSIGQGTSFSSPRVAGVAARLFGLFREQIAEDQKRGIDTACLVRLALLMSAAIPIRDGELAPLEVRSGGALDEARALWLASVFWNDLLRIERKVLARSYRIAAEREFVRRIAEKGLRRIGDRLFREKVALFLDRRVLIPGAAGEAPP